MKTGSFPKRNVCDSSNPSHNEGSPNCHAGLWNAYWVIIRFHGLFFRFKFHKWDQQPAESITAHKMSRCTHFENFLDDILGKIKIRSS